MLGKEHYKTHLFDQGLVVVSKEIGHNDNRWTETQVLGTSGHLIYTKVYVTLDVNELGMYHDEMVSKVKDW